MTDSETYLYSPLSQENIQNKNHPALLLQFILSEFIHAKEDFFTIPLSFFPYDWSQKVGCINKIREHARLLAFAFPDLKEQADSLQNFLDDISLKHLQKLYIYLLPFLIACRENAHLLLFLLQNKKIDLLSKIFPEGLEQPFYLMKEQYCEQGYSTLLPEIKRLITSYEY